MNINSIFKSNSKVHWFVSGVSLFMYQTSADFGQLYTGIINDKGIYGLWYLWIGLFTAGFVLFYLLLYGEK